MKSWFLKLNYFDDLERGESRFLRSDQVLIEVKP